MSGRTRFLVGLGLLVALPAATDARSAARLDYRGLVLPNRQVERLAEVALAAPGDSLRLDALLGDLVARLQSLGFLDARATAEWSLDRESLSLEVHEGERYRLSGIRVQAPSARDSQAILGTLPFKAGDWASPPGVARGLEASLNTLVDRGYPYATLGVRSWETDSAHDVALELTGGIGPLVTIHGVRLEGLRVTRADFAEKSMGRITGLPYNRAAALAARERLLQLGLFRNVTFEGLEGESDWSRGRLVYRVEEVRANRFEGALGMQGDGGAVGLVRFDLGNLLGTGRAVGLAWESRGRGIAQFGAHYAEPLVFGTPLKAEVAFDQHVQDTLFSRTRWGARARLALSSQERLEAGYEEERVVQERNAVREAQLRTTTLALERSTLDRPLGPRTGTRLRVAAGQSTKRERLRPTGSRSARAGTVEVGGEWHRALGPARGIALEVLARGRFSSERVLPLFERYPLGGALTLRGYDEEQFRVDQFALARLEWRWFLGDGAQRLALFWDHARAATRVPVAGVGDRLEVLDKDGIGFGMRLEAGQSLIGLDYGLAPGRPPLEGKIHLQLISTF